MDYVAQIDYLAFTFPCPADVSPFRVLKRAAVTVEALGQLLAVGEIEPKGRHGYTWSASVMDREAGKVVGFVAAGGNNSGTCHVVITGAGCPLVDMRAVAELLARTGGWLTRVDIAVDDYEGKRTPQIVRQAYLDGAFKIRGQNPTPGQAGPWDDQEKWGAGLTYYVGKRQNGKMLRCYHKGREQGDSTSNWTRFEVELRKNYRELDPAILLDPMAGFVSAYPWLQWAVEEETHASVGFLRRQKQRARFGHLLRHAKRSYGKLIGVMVHHLRWKPDECINALVSIGKPSRLDTRFLIRAEMQTEGGALCYG